MTNLMNLTNEELDRVYDEACEATNECYYEWIDKDQNLTARNEQKWTKACKMVEAIEEEYKRRGLI